jgi:hypothetical protein
LSNSSFTLSHLFDIYIEVNKGKKNKNIHFMFVKLKVKLYLLLIQFIERYKGKKIHNKKTMNFLVYLIKDLFA